MGRVRGSILAGVLAAALVGVACSGGGDSAASSSSTASPVASPAAPAPHQTLFGVAGLIPRNFPRAEDADWRDLFAGLKDYGGLVGVYTNWADSAASEGTIPKAVESAFAAGKQYGFTPLVALGVPVDAGAKSPPVNYGDAAQRQRFVSVAKAVAEKHRPRYLAIGVEVNRLVQGTDTTQLDGFVEWYTLARDAVKAASPATNVFTVFQLEIMSGQAIVTGDTALEPQWQVVARFGDTLDLVAFTTYPFLNLTSPAELPAGYYASVAERFKVPVAFTEVGWPSGPLPGALAEYGGTPEEQAAFAARFLELVRPANPAFALWAFPHDVGDATIAPFRTVALRENNGTPKPAYEVWRRASSTR